jgi:hypothetical protein
MDIGIGSRLTTGFAAVSVGVLVMTPAAADQPPPAPTPTVPPAVTFAAVTQPLRAPHLLIRPTTPTPHLLMRSTTPAPAPPSAAVQSTTPAPAQPVASVQPMKPAPAQPVASVRSMTPAPTQPSASVRPLDLLGQQVSFHVEFVTDFVTTGAVLFGRQLAIPGALVRDINNGVPLATAVSRALATFVQIELEAGGQLVNFAARYVSFQLNFVANLVATSIAAVGEVATSLVASLTPASATPTVATADGSQVTPATRPSARRGPTSATSSGDVTTAKVSETADTVTQKPKRFRSTGAQSDSATSTTKIRHDDAEAGASDQAGGDAPQSRGRSGVTHDRNSDTGSSTSGGGRRAHAGDTGDQHEPKHRHDRDSKGDGKKGDGKKGDAKKGD